MSNLITVTRKDYLDSLKVLNTRLLAEKALNYWDKFLISRKLKEQTFIVELKQLWKNPEDTTLYQYINLFAQFLISAKLHPRTTRIYISRINQYLRYFGIRIYKEDMKQ